MVGIRLALHGINPCYPWRELFTWRTVERQRLASGSMSQK
jgi:hypothetical protein